MRLLTIKSEDECLIIDQKWLKGLIIGFLGGLLIWGIIAILYIWIRYYV